MRKYLVYAVGEIQLVMIGILLALQVNTWNQQSNALRLELEALIDLRAEFVRNATTFEAHLEEKRKTASQWKRGAFR